ncbi:MAG: hypothetical protein KDK26_02660 [Roseivivax sp.]|nr:hypothetical protein [Roseivivax sp.]
MRNAIYVLVGVQVAILVFALISTSASSGMDAAGRGMAEGLLVAGGIAMAVIFLPAVLLAGNPRWQKLALGLALLFPALILLYLAAL